MLNFGWNYSIGQLSSFLLLLHSCQALPVAHLAGGKNCMKLGALISEIATATS